MIERLRDLLRRRFPRSPLVPFDCSLGRVWLRRPIVADLYELDALKDAGGDELAVAVHLIRRHVVSKRGSPLFKGLVSLDGIDAAFALHVVQRIESLYAACENPPKPLAR